MCCFHPTLVLAQPVPFFIHAPLKSFHPTLVLAQPKIQEESTDFVKFPSHIGSRSTRRGNCPRPRPPIVSIPHWFSLNGRLLILTSLGSKGFHPTLVLAQPKRRDCSCSIQYTFPSHIGSRSTRNLSVERDLFTSFHPTLVLAQPVRGRWLRRSQRKVSIPHWFSLN